MKLKNLLIALLIVVMFGGTVQASTSLKDLKETAWYFEDVTKLVNLGMVSGYPDGTFKPTAHVTNSEALKLILSATGIAPKEIIGEHAWADGYIQAALEKNIIAEKTFNKNALITRLEMADMIVRAVGGDFQTTVIKGYFDDTTNRSVEALYDMGLVSGVKTHEGLYYKPSEAITRAEVSVLVIRLLTYFESKVPEIQIIEPTVTTFAIVDNLKASERTLIKEPKQVEDFEKLLIHMTSNGVLEYEAPYDLYFTDLTDLNISDNIKTAFTSVFSKYPEYFSFTNNISLSQRGTTTGRQSSIIIQLKSSHFTQTQIKEKTKIFHLKTAQIVKDLIADKKLTGNMTDKEKAKVLYEWMALNNAYDLTLSKESFTGYGAAVNQLAVCQGYTAMYNLMCKLVGLEVEGITGRAGQPLGEHMWTRAVLDGTSVHIDVTFGDTVPDKAGYCNFDYFARESEFMRKTHTWDTNLFGK